MPNCPHCNAEIDYVEEVLQTTGWEQRSCSIRDWDNENDYFTDCEYGESETTDSDHQYYECPECRERINDTQISEMFDSLEEAQERTNAPGGGFQRPFGRGINLTNRGSRQITECPKCRHVYYDELSEEMICPKCNHEYGKENN